MSPLSILNDITNNLLFRIPDVSATKYILELEFIIHSIYLSWLIRDDPKVIITKKKSKVGDHS